MREERNGFSLMELMVVLLIVAIIAAASAPMVSRKLARDAAQGDSPWVYAGLANSIAYNMAGANATAMIGTAQLPNAAGNNNRPKLYIESNGNEPQIGFGRRGVNNMMSLTLDTQNQRIGLSDETIPNNSVILGVEHGFGVNSQATLANNILLGNDVDISVGGQRNITIGNGNSLRNGGGNNILVGYSSEAQNGTGRNILIGNDIHANNSSGAVNITNRSDGIRPHPGNCSVAIGLNAKASSTGSIAIGNNARSEGHNNNGGDGNIAIGRNATAFCSTQSAGFAIAIGDGARASGSNSIAIGGGAEAMNSNIIVLGRNQTVYIPGNLVVGGGAIIGNRLKSDQCLYLGMRHNDSSNRALRRIKMRGSVGGSNNDNSLYGEGTTNQLFTSYSDSYYTEYTSDRRLKNVGEKFTGGLDKIKKLEVFNYTFKKDEAKTPHVGVIAQDLKKVFPDAVIKGEDGYLRIRFEDMFYALINAVKELDNRITNAFDNITNINKRLDEQEKIIEQLKEQNLKLEKRLSELEKK